MNLSDGGLQSVFLKSDRTSFALDICFKITVAREGESEFAMASSCCESVPHGESIAKGLPISGTAIATSFDPNAEFFERRPLETA